MKALILHSDDLGYSLDANVRIFSAFDEGLLSSASIMVNMPGALPALKYASGIKGRFGLHLNLTEGYSLSDAAELPDLTDDSGRFVGPLRLAALAQTSGLNLSLRRQWRREIELQMQKAFDNGLQPSHVNGHHYIETFPSLCEDILTICARYGIRNIRVPVDPTPLRIFARHASPLKLPWFIWVRRNAAALWREAVARGFSFPEVTLGVGMAGRVNAELVDFWLKNYILEGRGRAEIIFHTGTPCACDKKRLQERFAITSENDENLALKELAGRRSEFLELADYSSTADRRSAN